MLLVDDHAILREGLARLLGQEKDIEVSGQGATDMPQSRLRLLMPGYNPDGKASACLGLTVWRRHRIIHGKHPKIGIIGLSMHDDANMTFEL